MKSSYRSFSLGVSAAVLAAVIMTEPGFAQAPAAEEIIVTARKRTETTLDVPVAITAMGKADLERYATNDMSQLASKIPGLLIQPIPGGAGGSIAVRGVSSTPSNPAGDQAVSFNIDGVQVSSANIIRLGQMDQQQIEILKGPQALFFGKNSPGGIISIRSADPGDYFEARARVGHEFYARETRGEVMLSSPINDKVGVRVAASGMGMEGWHLNRSPNSPAQAMYGPVRARDPERDEYSVRGTVVFRPTDTFNIRTKYNFDRLTGSDPWTTAERIACPNGFPQTGATPFSAAARLDNCQIDNVFYQGLVFPGIPAAYPQYFPGSGLETSQHLASLEANWEFLPDITLTSVSGYYKLHDAFYGPSVYQPLALLVSGTDTHRREISEEVRVTTNRAEWPVNFMIGGYYQDAKFSNAIPLFFTGPAVLPTFTGTNNFNEFFIDTTAYSFFGQAIWNVTQKIEFAAGIRYSSEEKELHFFQTTGGPLVFVRNEILTSKPKQKFTDASPEATITWKPTQDLSVFGAWRNGFKSGGFNTGGGGAAGLDLTYQPEDVHGWEMGIKTILASNLRLNVTAYRYLYKNMQVSTFDPNTARQTVVNAASARIKGIEGDIHWAPPSIEGLELRGAVNYNHARYKEFLSGCFNGQTIAQGCRLNANPLTGAFRQQDMKGRSLILAPDWTSSAGFTYSRPLGSNLMVSLTSDVSYSSFFWAQLEEAPLGRQKSFVMVDASLRLSTQNNRWELAVIGENLTEVLRSRFVSQVPGTGIGARTGTNLAGGLSDLSGQINRGRQVRLQLTYNFD